MYSKVAEVEEALGELAGEGAGEAARGWAEAMLVSNPEQKISRRMRIRRIVVKDS